MPRRCIASLKTLAIQEMAQLSLNAIESISLKEREETINWREWASNRKRKRSYSCGDEERGDSLKKKVSSALSLDVRGVNESGRTNKRKRDSDDSEDSDYEVYSATIENKRKRPRLDIDSRPSDENIKTKDDICVTYSASQLLFTVLKRYFHTMPSTLWNEYTQTLIDKAIRYSRFQDERNVLFQKILDHTFCGKLTRCSTSNAEVCLSHLEETLYRKLRCCGKLESLNMTVIPRNESGILTAITTLQRLQNLVILSLLPPLRYSFHWAFRVVGQHVRRLRELKVVYNGDLFSDGEGIADLQECRQMTSLWLFNFGRLCETKSVSCLLSALPDLKVLFHKELPNAVLEIYKDSQNTTQSNDDSSYSDLSAVNADERIPRVKQLGLERVDLCWYERSTGYQLVYVPSSYLLRVAQMCPNVKLLNLIGPPCLCDIAQRLSHLQVVILQQASLTSCLAKSLQNADLSALTVLRVSDVWDVTHDLISAVALKCPSLQALSVTSSSLEARGALTAPPRRSPFPCLREIELAPSALAGRPSLTSPSVWQLGAALTRYIVEGAPHLASVHLHFKDSDVPLEDVLSELDLETALCRPRPALRSLTLEWPPAASPTLVERLVEACPSLSTLAAITTWPLSPRQRADVIASFGHRIDIT